MPVKPIKSNAQAIDNQALKSGWRRVRFDQMAENIGDRVDDPSQAGVERYVGLEHLDPESLKLRRWGTPDEVEATKLRFQPGDIIFGKRRAYQRKLAVADFEGICSAHAMVLRAREDTVVKEFLPVFMQSEVFFERALSISVGSLSPTINWRTLAAQEFAIPPKDEQRRIADILWAAEESVVCYHGVHRRTDDVAAALRNSLTEAHDNRWETRPLVELSTSISKGESPAWQGFDYLRSGVLFITSENVLFGKYQREPDKFISEEFHKKLRRSVVRPGSVLINLVGASIGRACIAPVDIGEANVNQAVAVVTLNQAVLIPDYLLAFVLSQNGLASLLRNTVNTARANISLQNIRDLMVPVPPLDIQRKLCTTLTALIDAQNQASQHSERLVLLKKQLVEEKLRPGNSHV